jgi:circadian clock protein KaiB
MTNPDAIYHFRLYVAGEAGNSVEALANFRELCDRHLAGCCEVEVVDVFLQPQVAMSDGIFMTPTLLKLAPGKPRTVVGTLSDVRTVLQALELPVSRP